MDEILCGADEVRGLFQRKRSSIGFLQDPRVLSHLRKLHEAALRASAATEYQEGELLYDTETPRTEDRRLSEKITKYNRRMPYEPFFITYDKQVFNIGLLQQGGQSLDGIHFMISEELTLV